MKYQSRLKVKLSLISVMLVFPWTVQASDLPSAPLVADCLELAGGDSSADSGLCRGYIEGFLDSALMNDAAVIGSADQNQRDPSAFSQRAYRTRLGERAQSISRIDSPQFCLPDSVERRSIVLELATNLNTNALNSQALNQVLYQTARSVYPCTGNT